MLAIFSALCAKAKKVSPRFAQKQVKILPWLHAKATIFLSALRAKTAPKFFSAFGAKAAKKIALRLAQKKRKKISALRTKAAPTNFPRFARKQIYKKKRAFKN